MINTKTCLKCSQENQPDSIFCSKCGTVLTPLLSTGTPTVPVPEDAIKPTYPEHVRQLTQLHADILVLQVLGYEQPILVKGGVKIILGRYSDGDSAPSVDLTPYNANLLGVSRHHALITRPEKEYMIQDLNSTNGTWINEEKLTPQKFYPIRNGDLVRVGQLAFYVYFRAPETGIESDETISLKSNELTFKLTPNNLEQTLTPYLNALVGIQQICSQIHGQANTDITIRAITFENAIVAVKLSGAKESLQLTRSRFAQWYLANSSKIEYLTMKPGWQANDEKPLSSVTALPNNGNTAELTKELAEAEKRLADEMILDLIPDRSEDIRKTFAEKLLSHLHIMAMSQLKITTDNP